MAIRDILEISFSYVQYFLLIISIDPTPFPSYYRAPLTVLRYLNLDMTVLFTDGGALAGELPPTWPVDVRLQFIFVSVVLPLLLALTGLLSLAPKLFILWYTVLLAAVYCIVIAIFALGVNDPLVIRAVGSTNIYILLYCGLGGIVLCVVAAVAWRLYAKGKEVEQDNRTYDDIMEAEVGAIDWGAVLFRGTYSCLLLFFGLQLLGAFEVPVIMTKGALGVIGLALGAVMVTIAAVLLTWTAISFSATGRLFQFKVGEVVKNNFLSVLLLLISLLYIPAVSNVVLVINCQSLSCGRNERFFDGGSAIEPADPTLQYCETCSFATPQQCPVSLQTALCGAEATSSSRLYRDPDVRCDQLREYFWPASGIMFFSYVLCMPIINFVLTARSTRKIAQEFPLDTQESVGLTDQEAFEEKVHASNNAAKFIYDPFQLRWKHWRMLFLFQKLCTVLAAVYVFSSAEINSAQMGLGLTAFVHFVCWVYIVITRPFKRKVENFLTVATQTMLLFASGTGVAGAQGVAVPETVYFSVAIAAGAIPLLALIIGSMLTVRDARRKKETRDRRIQRAIEAIEDAEEEELEDLYGDEDDVADDDLDALHGTLRGLPSKSNLRAVSKPERATQRVKVQSTAAPSHGDQKQKSAAARRRAKHAGGGAGSPRGGGGGSDFANDIGQVSSSGSDGEPSSPAGGNRQGRFTIKMDANNQKGNASGPRQLTTGAASGKNGPPKGGRRGPTLPPPDSDFGNAGESPAASPANKRDQTPAMSAMVLEEVGSDSDTTALVVPARRKNRMRLNTRSQSERAKRNWTRAKMRVLQVVREEMLKREEEEEKRNGGTGAQARTKAAAKRSNKQMAGWDKLVIMLMKKDATKNAKKKKADGAAMSPKDDGDAVHAEMNGTLARLDSNLRQIGSLQAQQSLSEEEMRNRLLEIYEHHLGRVLKVQQAVDFRINEDTTNTLHIFFMVIGMFAFVAFGCCTLGVVQYSETRYFTAHDAAGSNVGTEFAGYQSWDEFTSECCCVQHTGLNATTTVDLEKWLCRNNRVKERVRRVATIPAKDVTAQNAHLVTFTDGYSVRALCSPVFVPSSGCNVTVVNDTSAVELTGCSANISATARDLW